MAKPPKPAVPDRAIRSQPENFAANADAWITYQWGVFPDYIDASVDFIDDRVAAAEAAALVSGESSGLDLTGRSGDFVRVNSEGTSLGFLSGTNLANINNQLTADLSGGFKFNQNGTGDRSTFLDLHSSEAADANSYSARMIRNEGDDGTFDFVQTGTGAIRLQGDTEINGTVTGTGIATTADAETGTGDGIMNATLTKAAIDAQVVGNDQTWQSFVGSRSIGTSYQNTTGKAIGVSVTAVASASSAEPKLQASTDNSTWVSLCRGKDGADYLQGSAIIPDGHYYRVDEGARIEDWAELR